MNASCGTLTEPYSRIFALPCRLRLVPRTKLQARSLQRSNPVASRRSRLLLQQLPLTRRVAAVFIDGRWLSPIVSHLKQA